MSKAFDKSGEISPASALHMLTMFFCYADPRWDEIKKFLKAADTDKNGILSKEEFKKGVQVACGVSEEEADSIVEWVSTVL